MLQKRIRVGVKVLAPLLASDDNSAGVPDIDSELSPHRVATMRVNFVCVKRTRLNYLHPERPHGKVIVTVKVKVEIEHLQRSFLKVRAAPTMIPRSWGAGCRYCWNQSCISGGPSMSWPLAVGWSSSFMSCPLLYS